MTRFRLWGRTPPPAPVAGWPPPPTGDPAPRWSPFRFEDDAAGSAEGAGAPPWSPAGRDPGSPWRPGPDGARPPWGSADEPGPASGAATVDGRAGPSAGAAGGPATRAARPAYQEPATDPFGFPPIRAVPEPAPAGQQPHPGEAAALAGAFAADYLSWDEDDPDRRGRVLAEYLPVPAADPARLGWSGRGRQRADFALPGRVRADGDGRVLVDVRVRVTPYRAVGTRRDEPVEAAEPEVAAVPAAAPAPTARGWRGLAGFWVRLSVPVALDRGRLVVDAWEETLGEEPAAPPPAEPPADDCALDDDDPLAEPVAGGAR